MSDEHRESRKKQERRKGWIGIAVWILTAGVVIAIISVAPNLGAPTGDPYYIYFEESVAGLLRNSKVKYRGVRVGKVHQIELTTSQRVLSEDGTRIEVVERLTPIVECVIYIDADNVIFNQNSRAFLKTNPLSGMQQIDINDRTSASGAQLIPSETGFVADLYAGGVDLDGWIDVNVEGRRVGSVRQIEFDGDTAQVTVLMPYRLRNMDPSTLRARADSALAASRASIDIVSVETEPEAPYTVRHRDGSTSHLVIELPCEAISIDPLVIGNYEQSGGQARLRRLTQAQEVGDTGAQLKYLVVELSGAIEKLPEVTGQHAKWLSIQRDLVRDVRQLEVEIIHEGNALEPGSPIVVARSPTAILMERANTLAEFVDHLPAIARNVEAASANVVGLTSDLRVGAVNDLRAAITSNSDKLEEAISDLRQSLLEKLSVIADNLGGQINRLGDTTVSKIDTALDEETLANFKAAMADIATSTSDWKAGIAAARGTFEQAKDIVGFKSADGRTLAQTVDQLASALQKVDGVLADNANQVSTVMGALKDTLNQFQDAIKSLDELIRNLNRND